VSLTFAWLDGREQHLGFKALRLPDGEWPEWVTLQQAGLPPAGAVWVGMGLRVQNKLRATGSRRGIFICRRVLDRRRWWIGARRMSEDGGAEGSCETFGPSTGRDY
jgi:hypothetical protein